MAADELEPFAEELEPFEPLEFLASDEDDVSVSEESAAVHLPSAQT